MPVPEDIGNPAPAVAAEAPQGANQAPAPAEGTAPSPEAPEVPFLFAKPKQQREAGPDPSKLPAELQPFYKLMQGDYTRTKQELADERRRFSEERQSFEKSQQMFREYMDRLAQPRQQPTGDPNADIAAQISQLREEGRHAEADAALMRLFQAQAESQVQPIKAQAEISAKKAAFRDVVSDLQLNDPFIKTYGKEVAQQFDSQNPVMDQIRSIVLADEGKMRTLLPVVLRALAIEQHATRLEHNFEQAVEQKVKATLAAERSKANGVPARLVESGATSKNGARLGGSLDDIISRAIENYGG